LLRIRISRMRPPMPHHRRLTNLRHRHCSLRPMMSRSNRRIGRTHLLFGSGSCQSISHGVGGTAGTGQGGGVEGVEYSGGGGGACAEIGGVILEGVHIGCGLNVGSRWRSYGLLYWVFVIRHWIFVNRLLLLLLLLLLLVSSRMGGLE